MDSNGFGRMKPFEALHLNYFELISAPIEGDQMLPSKGLIPITHFQAQFSWASLQTGVGGPGAFRFSEV